MADGRDRPRCRQTAAHCRAVRAQSHSRCTTVPPCGALSNIPQHACVGAAGFAILSICSSYGYRCGIRRFMSYPPPRVEESFLIARALVGATLWISNVNAIWHCDGVYSGIMCCGRWWWAWTKSAVTPLPTRCSTIKITTRQGGPQSPNAWCSSNAVTVVFLFHGYPLGGGGSSWGSSRSLSQRNFDGGEKSRGRASSFSYAIAAHSFGCS